MFVVKIISTTIFAIISMILLASAFVSKNKSTNLTVTVLILSYLLAIFCMWA